MYNRKSDKKSAPSEAPTASILVESFLSSLLHNLTDTTNSTDNTVTTSQQKINSAIRDRQMIRLKNLEKGAKLWATLDDIKGEVKEESGKWESTGKYEFHDEARFKKEVADYLREQMSDWEKMAFTAVYFDVGSSVGGILTKHFAMQGISDPKVREDKKKAEQLLLEVTREIADALKETLGFTNQKGFTLKPEALEQLRGLIKNPNHLIQEVEFKIQLREHLAKLETKAKEYSAGEKKGEIYKEAIAAVKAYLGNKDLSALNTTVTATVSKDENRKHGMFGSHTTTALLKELQNMVVERKNKSLPSMEPPTP